MHSRFPAGGMIIIGIIGTAIFFSRPARAEWAISGYLGAASTINTDVVLERPDNTSLTYSNVHWMGKSFSGFPYIYYGFRGVRWHRGNSFWGIGVDFTHAKMLAKLDEIVAVSGTRKGIHIDHRERLNETFETLEFTNGHNLLTVNNLFRWLPKGVRDDTLRGRLYPYCQFGLGIAFPHVEATLEGDETYEYQVVGLAGLAGAGLNFDVTGWLSTFSEYRLSYADIDASLTGGGHLKTKPWTHHFAFGLSINLLR